MLTPLITESRKCNPKRHSNINKDKYVISMAKGPQKDTTVMKNSNMVLNLSSLQDFAPFMVSPKPTWDPPEAIFRKIDPRKRCDSSLKLRSLGGNVCVCLERWFYGQDNLTLEFGSLFSI